MKAILIGLTALMSSGFAMAACPSYNGNFMCKGEGIEQAMTLKTEEVNGVYQYSLDTTTVIADGVVRPVEFQGGIFDMAATCAEDHVTVKIQFPGGEGDNEACGAEKWDLFYTLNFQPNGPNITETHHSDAVCASGKVVPSEEKGTLECVRQ